MAALKAVTNSVTFCNILSRPFSLEPGCIRPFAMRKPVEILTAPVYRGGFLGNQRRAVVIQRSIDDGRGRSGKLVKQFQAPYRLPML